jgi:predicted Ser/Thr protein kinase
MFTDSGMKRLLGAQFYACGAKELPGEITINSGRYSFVRELKHDFFAATGLYHLSNGNGSSTGLPEKVVLKVSRRQNLLGLPMSWLGAGMCEREIANLKRLADLKCVPHLLSCYGKDGIVYEYIEGRPLDQPQQLSDDFFEKLRNLLKELHRRNLIYVDMNKRDNVIVGEDGEPYLIDFQISVHVPSRILISRRLSERLLDTLKTADIYHLYKLKRRIQPEHLTQQEHKISRRRTNLIKIHRLFATPLRKLRRSLIRFLRDNGYLFRQGRS